MSMNTKQLSKTAIEKIVVAEWKSKLSTNPVWATRGLLAIYKGQTESEKMAGNVTADNGIGFTGTDAEILSSFAKQFQQRGTLSEKQMAILYKKMPKYAGQLRKVSAT
jgi:hypothetical protein